MRPHRNTATSHDTASAATAATSPSPAKGWTDPLPGPRPELARAILAALPAAERRTVYTDLRDFLRVLHGAYMVEAFAHEVRTAYDSAASTEAREGASNAAGIIAGLLEIAPHRGPLAALCGAVLNADPVRLAGAIGEDEGGADARRVRRALRILRAEYSDLRGVNTVAVAGGAQ